MAITLVRKPSETPNINNLDDFRMFRYATGGYNGVIKNYANECNYQISGSNFTIKSGEIVIDGVQAKIDGSGVTIAVDNISGTQYYSIYCEIDLSIVDSQNASIKAVYNTSNYPQISNGDDLTQITTGIARIELYRFQVTNGTILNVVKRFTLIEYGQSKKAETATIALYASEDTSKGTIEERLTNLGFKQGSVMPANDASVVKSNIVRQGNFCIIKELEFFRTDTSTDPVLGVLDVNFRPKTDIEIYINSSWAYKVVAHIYKTGQIKVLNVQSLVASFYLNNIGFECEPIT